jgi:hypothetical protein
MVQVIYGFRGSGKTKRIMDMAREELNKSKGNVVFIEKDNRCMLTLPHDIRYVNASEYGVRTSDKLFGFISGMLAANFDIVTVFLDAMPSIAGFESARDTEAFLNDIIRVTQERDVDLVISMSACEGDVPEFLKPYLI